MDKQISESLKQINHLINNCLDNFSVLQLEEVRSRHEMLMKQQFFWLAQNNSKRFFYDLKDYGIWLCDFIAEVESKLGEDKNWENYS